MNLLELLGAVAADLEHAGVTYALTGSLASSLYSRPQMSYDADLVLRMTEEQAGMLARTWRGRFYVSLDALREAVAHNGMANVIDGTSGWKVDLSIVPRDPFYDAVLARRRCVSLPGTTNTLWACSPEDTILMKLLWRKDSRSSKQFNDARNVVEAMGHRLDWHYLREWATRLALSCDLEELREAALP